jgi:hypothetical protein
LSARLFAWSRHDTHHDWRDEPLIHARYRVQDGLADPKMGQSSAVRRGLQSPATLGDGLETPLAAAKYPTHAHLERLRDGLRGA